MLAPFPFSNDTKAASFDAAFAYPPAGRQASKPLDTFDELSINPEHSRRIDRKSY